jgi:iron uptake system component EfeO
VTRIRFPTALAAIATVCLVAALVAACGSDEDEGAAQAPATAPEPAASTASSEEADAAVAEYRAFAVANAERHADAFARFAAALRDGDVEHAQAIYPEARMPWERIEPVAGLFGDLDPALDAREGDVPDDTWGGWHYFEKALWIGGSTAGLAPYIAETEADAQTLIAAAETVEISAADVAGGAVELLDEVSASKITGEEERYSHTDLWDFQANVEGSRAAFEAVEPMLADGELADEIAGRFDELQAALDRYRRGDGFVSYTEVTKSQRRALSRLIDATAEPLSKVAPQLES